MNSFGNSMKIHFHKQPWPDSISTFDHRTGTWTLEQEEYRCNGALNGWVVSS
jgi:hypothetical protein